MMSHLREYQGKTIQDVGRGDLDLGKLDTEEEKQAQEKVAEQMKGLIERSKAALAERVSEVRLTHRLTDSPACIVIGDDDMGGQMRRLLQQTGQAVPVSKPIFELNPAHLLVQKLDQEADEDRFRELIGVIFDHSMLAEGGHLEDSAAHVRSVNKLLLEILG